MKPSGGMVIAGFPNPIGWAIDKVTGLVGGVASAGFEAVIGGLMGWVTDAVVWVIGGVFDFFLDASDPNVQADWFVAGDGPYGTTARIGATLLVGCVLAGITQGALNGDVAGMVRRMAVDLPVSVLGMVGLVAMTQAGIRLTDSLSTWVMRSFQEDISDFTAIVTSLSRLAGGTVSSFVVLLLGLVTVLAGLILVGELAVRAALIYLVVAFAPMVFAARLWPGLQDAGKKLLHLLVALILSKLVMAVALSVAASAAVGTGSGGEVNALPEPEVSAEDPGGSVTQAVGILLAAVAAFGVAAFSPLTVAKLLPLAESATVAQGIRGMPLRGAQQGASMAYYSQTLLPKRGRQLANGSGTPGPPSAIVPGGFALRGLNAGAQWLAQRTGSLRRRSYLQAPPPGPPPTPTPRSGRGRRGGGAGGGPGQTRAGGASGQAGRSAQGGPVPGRRRPPRGGGTAGGGGTGG